MDRFAHLQWPFFEERHRKLAREAEAWAKENLSHAHGDDADAICKRLVQDLGCAGYLGHCASERPDVRSIALLREVFAYHAGLADFSFVMQGLGSGAIALAGSASQKQQYLSKAASGDAIAAFALSEPDAGSDVQALKTTAKKQGGAWTLDGTKTWISNGGIAHFYVVFARADEGISAFVVEAKDLDASERIEIVAPHPMAVLKLKNSRATLLGEPGQGFKLAMRNLDIFRTTVAGAALGFARRALDESLSRAKERKMFNQTLAEFQLTQAKLADMATAIDAGALLAYRAAWARDVQGKRITREAAMAKMHATEAAQQVIDDAVQICGGLGVMRGHPVERLYREVRALRIYEGATEVQKLIIARDLLKGS
jgi:alkylation response protein AidB-like acyl-CoA dehydrogenase